jgi:hypothetical protein
MVLLFAIHCNGFIIVHAALTALVCDHRQRQAKEPQTPTSESWDACCRCCLTTANASMEVKQGNLLQAASTCALMLSVLINNTNSGAFQAIQRTPTFICCCCDCVNLQPPMLPWHHMSPEAKQTDNIVKQYYQQQPSRIYQQQPSSIYQQQTACRSLGNC